MRPIYGLEASVREDVDLLRKDTHIKSSTGGWLAGGWCRRRLDGWAGRKWGLDCQSLGPLPAERNDAAAIASDCTPAAIYGLVFETESGALREVCRDEGVAAGPQ